MRKQGGGFGLIILVVVVAVVLLLATKAWKSVMPTAAQLDNGPELAEGVPDHGQTEAAEELRSPGLPNLDDMRDNTSEHADRYQEILEQAN